MALVGNGVRLSTSAPMRQHGAASAGSQTRHAPTRNAWAGAFAAKSAFPEGYLHPYAWLLPPKAGGLASGGRILGAGTISSANLAGGYNLAAALTGAGGVTNAALALVVSAVAALSGSSALAAAVTGKLEAAAALSGSAALAGNLGALADLVAALSGDATVVAGITAKGALASDVNATATLTVGAIADAVWDEVLSGHLTSGTTGAALNGAGSAGDPWGTELPGSYGSGTAGKLIGDLLEAGSVDGLDVLEALRIGLAVLAGKTSGFASGAGTRTVRAVDDSKDRLVAVQDENANRTATTLDGS